MSVGFGYGSCFDFDDGIVLNRIVLMVIWCVIVIVICVIVCWFVCMFIGMDVGMIVGYCFVFVENVRSDIIWLDVGDMVDDVMCIGIIVFEWVDRCMLDFFFGLWCNFCDGLYIGCVKVDVGVVCLEVVNGWNCIMF